jgi:hypothetical protein
MNKRLLLTLLAVVTLGVAGTLFAATAHAAPRASGQKVLFDCPGAPTAEVKPAGYTTFCGDGGDSYSKMNWTSWTSQMATATSLLGHDNCVPSCAAGKTKEYQALNILWGSAAVKGHPGELAYTHMTVIFPGARPSGYSQTTTIQLYVP